MAAGMELFLLLLLHPALSSLIQWPLVNKWWNFVVLFFCCSGYLREVSTSWCTQVHFLWLLSRSREMDKVFFSFSLFGSRSLKPISATCWWPPPSRMALEEGIFFASFPISRKQSKWRSFTTGGLFEEAKSFPPLCAFERGSRGSEMTCMLIIFPRRAMWRMLSVCWKKMSVQFHLGSPLFW